MQFSVWYDYGNYILLQLKTIKGTRFPDMLEASRDRSSKVLGLDGNDTLLAYSDSKKNILDGGPGDDFIATSITTKKAFGGDGDDEINVNGIGNDVLISGGKGNDLIKVFVDNNMTRKAKGWRIKGGSGDDTIIYNGLGDDRISRSASNTKILGGAGNDYIEAAITLNDKTRIYGGKGDDRIRFGFVPQAKKTYVYGGPGKDTLILPSSPKVSGNANSAILTFQSYMLNGKGYQQKIYLSGIETLSINGQEIFL
jgi:Ca2+-binding RTX toxin-like protein